MSFRSVARTDFPAVHPLEPRRLLDGAVLDTTFLEGGGGWPFLEDELIERVQPLPDGQIAAVGHTNASTPQSPDLLFVRLNDEGQRDASFGAGGRIVRTLTGGTLLNIDINSAGQVAAALRTPDDALTIHRFTADARADRAFDSDGQLTTTVARGAADALRYRAAIEIDLTESGSVGVFFRRDAHFRVARFLPDGRRDAGFGSRGLILFDDADGQTRRSSVLAAAIGDDGRVLVGGDVPRDFNGLFTQSYTIVDRAGRPVTNTGLALTGEDDTDIVDVALRPGDGAAFGIGDYFGQNWPVSHGTNTRFFDESVPDGLWGLEFDRRLTDIAFGPDGGVFFVGGVRRSDGRNDALVIRFTPEGRVDRAFGNQGFVLLDRSRTEDDPFGHEFAERAVVDQQGRVLLVTRSGEQRHELIRLSAEQPNPSFARVTRRGTLLIEGGDGDDDVHLGLGFDTVVLRRGRFESIVLDATKVARVYFDGGAGDDQFAWSHTTIKSRFAGDAP